MTEKFSNSQPLQNYLRNSQNCIFFRQSVDDLNFRVGPIASWTESFWWSKTNENLKYVELNKQEMSKLQQRIIYLIGHNNNTFGMSYLLVVLLNLWQNFKPRSKNLIFYVYLSTFLCVVFLSVFKCLSHFKVQLTILSHRHQAAGNYLQLFSASHAFLVKKAKILSNCIPKCFTKNILVKLHPTDHICNLVTLKLLWWEKVFAFTYQTDEKSSHNSHAPLKSRWFD